MARTNNGQGTGLHWTDVLFVPLAIVGSFVLMRWLPIPLAITASAVINLMLFALFEPRKPGLKRFVLAIVIAALITFILAAIRYWLF